MNYILRYTGEGVPDLDSVKKVLNAHDITILDSSDLPKMALVGNVAEHLLATITAQLPGNWDFFAQQEQKYRVPDTRRKIAPKK